MIGKVRHLSDDQVGAALRRGVSVEQLLGATPAHDQGTVAWLTLSTSGTRVILRLHQVSDEGSDEFVDVYEFTPIDEAEDMGEGRVIETYADVRSALDAAIAHGAKSGQWVNAGVIQGEYRDARAPD